MRAINQGSPIDRSTSWGGDFHSLGQGFNQKMEFGRQVAGKLR